MNGDSSSQEGNCGIGNMSGGVVKDDGKVVGKIEKKKDNQSQNTNNNITLNVNTGTESNSSKREDALRDNQDTIKMSIKKGDTEASIEAPNSVETLKMCFDFLRQKFDISLEVKDIEKSSIKFILKGSEQGLNKIAKSFKSGELAPLLKQKFHLELEDAKLIESDSSENLQIDQSQKLLALTIAGNVNQADIDILKAALIDTSDDEEEIGIHQDKHIRQQAEKLIQEVSTSTSVKIADSQVAIGDTVTSGAILDKSVNVSSQGPYISSQGPYIEGEHNQVNIKQTQTRLAVLLGILALALVGVVVYLIKTEKIQLPGRPNQVGSIEEPLSIPPEEPPSIEDIEINIRNVASRGRKPEFQGVATNVGTTEITEFFIIAIISEIRIVPKDLSGSKFVSVIHKIRNLKPGETRQIGGYFNLDYGWIEEIPESYKDKNFEYTVTYGGGFSWSIHVADRKSLEICSKDESCAMMYRGNLTR